MTKQNNDFPLSRRTVLGGLGTVGLASAGAGLGTSAYFSDTEAFRNNTLDAGSLDLYVDYFSHVDQGSYGVFSVAGTNDGGDDNGDPITSELTDVKPGDSGTLAFCFEIDDNPAYLWTCGELVSNDENGAPEPEATGSPDTTLGDPGLGEGELAQSIEVVVSYCEVAADVDANGTAGFDAGDLTPVAERWTGTLADFLATVAGGVPLDGMAGEPESGGFYAPGEQSCYAGTATAAESDAVNPCLCIDWVVPTTVGNEIQTDSLSFAMAFHAVQCRHNDGTANPCAPIATTDVNTGFVDVTPQVNQNGGYGQGGEDFASKTMTGRARYGDSGGGAESELVTGKNGDPTGDGQNIDWTPFFDQPTPFTFTYDADAATGTFALANGAVSSTVTGVGAPAGRIGLQAKADEATVTVDDVALSTGGTDFTIVGPDGFGASNDDAGREIAYLVVESTAADLADGFVLSGVVTLSPQGDFPGGNEDLALDVVVE
jgi:predicted ribosomally synthesized peptide with SipW-like signal peptide